MKQLLLILSIWLLLPLTSQACVWDSDTLEMERQAFPQILELITGKFIRHSPDFYQWRIHDRLQQLKEKPNQLELYDDLAVAYEKVGNTELAIQTILKKEKLKPGLYKTYANLGTFYIHQKKWKKGLEFIEKAIKINSNAHFGREKYQLLLVKYVLSRNQELPLGLGPHDANFTTFLAENDENDWPAAIKGISGMMHFGQYNSPILLEVLGDLLQKEGHQHLAARAYLKASFETKATPTSEKYTHFVYESLANQENMQMDKLIPIFKHELAEANSWYQKLQANEKKWIKSGLNPEEEFKKVYYQNPRIQNGESSFLFYGLIIIGFLGVTGIGFFYMRYKKRQKSSA